MTPARRVRIGASVLLAILVVGFVGYMAIEGARPLDALYMVVITVSTVGYAELFPLSDIGRVFTIVLITGGVGAAFFTATSAIEVGIDNLVGRRPRHRMEASISRIEDHIILAGFGRVGRGTHDQLSASNVPVVVIEQDQEAAEAAREAGALVVEGNATTNRALENAGIHRARALIACVEEDSDNLVIVLSAKAMRADLWVVARATVEESHEKLVLAGADRVVSPQTVGAHRLAALALGSGMAEFLDLVVEGALVELQVQGFEVAGESPLAGVSLRQASIREQSGASILAIEDAQGDLALNPDPDIVIVPGQVLYGIGTEDQLYRLSLLLRIER